MPTENWLGRIEERIQKNGFPLCRSELLQDVRKLARALRHTQEPLRLAIYGEATDEMLEVAWATAERTLREVAGEPEKKP